MRDARLDRDWADDTYSFRLGFGQLVELQEQCDAGPYVILNRLLDGSWRVQDISHVIRIGLIGGGMKPEDALKKVRTYVQDRPPAENLPIAQAVLMAGISGAPEEKVGEPDAAKRKRSMTSRMGKSALPPSTEPAP